MNFFDIFDSKAIAAYWTDVSPHLQDPYLGQSLFPNAKQTGLELSWIKGRNELPVALQPSAFDTKAPLRDRIGVTRLSTEMPFFREAMRIGERDRQQIETFLKAGEQFAQPIIQRTFDDIAQLVAGANVQAERMRMQLITTGNIKISAGDKQGRNVDYIYNYDTEGTWKSSNVVVLAGDEQWISGNKAKSNPLKAINAVIAAAREKGTILSKLIMNSKTFAQLIESESIVKAIAPVGHERVFVGDEEFKNFVEKSLGVTISLYDKAFKDENGDSHKFIKDGVVSLIPDGVLGNTWYGTTPEEFDLMGGNAAESVSIVETGVAITTIKEAHPVNVQTVVSEIVLPSFENMDAVYVLEAF